MDKIRLRTKIEVIIGASLLLVMTVVSVASVSRTITDTSDNVDTFIRNSNGNYWEATGSNIQAAIDDLGIQPPANQGWGGVHGTVWLPETTTITTSSTITIKPHVTLDMGGCVIKPNGDFEVVNLTIGSVIKNGCINVSDVTDYSSSCIGFNSYDHLSFREHPPKIYDMVLVSDGCRGTGIYLHTWGSEYSQYITFGEFHNIKLIKLKYGIHINQTVYSNEAYINGNTFSNIVGYGCKYFITVREYYPEASGNIFHNVKCYCTSDTEYIIWNNGNGNIYDTVIAFNWDNNSGTRTAYNFSVDSQNSTHHAAHQCFLSFIGGGNDIAIGAWNRWTPSNRYTILDLENSELTIGGVNEVG